MNDDSQKDKTDKDDLIDSSPKPNAYEHFGNYQKESQPDEESEKEPESKKSGNMPFLDHIEELRWRLLKGLISIVVLAILAFAFADYVFKFLIMPLGDVKLHFTEVTGSFYAYLKVSLFAGLFLALPIVFYQLWKFIGPGLYDQEKKVVLPMAFFSTILFLGGASFCFFLVLPFAIKFLIGYGGELLNPIITVSSYISFAGLLIVAFGLAFQVPVIGYFLGKIGIINGAIMAKARPYAIVVFLIGAAILTPPDVFTQILLAGPLYALYEITIILVKLTGKKKSA
ncbi:MAG: twin-arginine translocase subunit TatC [Candidatus Zixiibacteriota bacterium]